MRPKYKAKKAIHAGLSYDSGQEAAYAAQVIDAGRADGEILYVVRHPKFHLGVPENVYVADFLVVCQRLVYVVDVKGTETPKFRRDKKLWASYGPAPLVVVKLDCRYPKAGVGGLPTIRKVVREVIPGGLDRRIYSPSLHPAWILPPGMQGDIVL